MNRATQFKPNAQNRKSAWERIQRELPEWAGFVQAMRQTDQTTRLLHTEIDGAVIQTTREYEILRRQQDAETAHVASMMDVERIR